MLIAHHYDGLFAKRLQFNWVASDCSVSIYKHFQLTQPMDSWNHEITPKIGLTSANLFQGTALSSSLSKVPTHTLF